MTNTDNLQISTDKQVIDMNCSTDDFWSALENLLYELSIRG